MRSATMPSGSVRTHPQHCQGCGKLLPVVERPTRPRLFCNSTCRSREYWRREREDLADALDKVREIRATMAEVEEAIASRVDKKSRPAQAG